MNKSTLLESILNEIKQSGVVVSEQDKTDIATSVARYEQAVQEFCKATGQAEVEFLKLENLSNIKNQTSVSVQSVRLQLDRTIAGLLLIQFQLLKELRESEERRQLERDKLDKILNTTEQIASRGNLPTPEHNPKKPQPNKIYTYEEVEHIISSGSKVNLTDEMVYIGNDGDEPVYIPVNDLVHFLVIGQTGSGKSTTINNFIILNHLIQSEKSKWYFADGKDGGDFDLLTGICKSPRPVAVPREEDRLAELSKMIDEVWSEYLHRQVLFKEARNSGKTVRNIFEYRKEVGELPRIWIVIDELKAFFSETDFNECSQVEDSVAYKIVRLLAESRSFGFTFILASQRFQQDTLPTVIRVNLPSIFIHSCSSMDKAILGVEFESMNKGYFQAKMDGYKTQELTIPYLGNYKAIDKFMVDYSIDKQNKLNSSIRAEKPKGFFKRLWDKLWS